jgi:cobalt-zinc-cadmium efflux system outer membrane protein
MQACRATLVLAVTAVVWVHPSVAQEPAGALTLDQALARARERAPRLVAARMRVDEARGRLTGASVRLRENPVVDMALGTRRSAVEDSREAELGITQMLETGGRRDARVAAADAGVDRVGAEVEVATQGLLREVAGSFQRALHATEYVRLTTETESLAAEALRTAQRRNELGEVPRLDVHVARVGWAGSRSNLRAAQAQVGVALGELRLLLGMDPHEPLAVAGDLHTRSTFDLQALLARAAHRPELRVLAAEVREAEAEVRLGQGYGWPELGLGLRYEQEEGDDIYLGGVSIVLPVFERGQGLEAEAGARVRRLRLELDTARRAIDVQVRSAFDVWRQRTDAVLEIEGEALTSLAESERLARRAYETGAFGVAELLLLRRETAEIRRRHLDRALEASLAAIELEAAAGVK